MAEPTKDTIERGLRISGARLAARLTQVDVAKAMGVSSVTVSNWETGKQTPETLDAIMRLAEVLRTTPCELAFGGAGNVVKPTPVRTGSPMAPPRVTKRGARKRAS